MDKYKIAVDMLIETVEFLIEGLEYGEYEVHQDDREKLYGEIKNIKRRIKVVEKFKGDM